MSIALPAGLPGALNPPFDSAPVLHSNSGSPNRRKQSRNPKLPPLPAFSFNPSATSEEDKEKDSEHKPARAPSPTHPILEEMAARQEPRKTPRPIPLPAFSFNPGASAEPDASPIPSPTHPILEEMAQNRSSRSSRPATLTDLNLSSRSSEQYPSPSPTKSIFGDTNVPARNVSHRRRGSEFVGAGSDGSHLASPTMMSTSPNKADLSKAQGPPVTGPGPGRHRHRRSEAVSISGIDASDLIKANAVAKHKVGSAPSTPIETVEPLFFLGDGSPSTRQSISNSNPDLTTTSNPHRRESAPGIRPRVGFSDRVDFIPRPLSLISSETDGSTSTVRGAHSLTGSVNSFAAAVSPAPSTPSFVLTMDDGSPRRRPNTADAAGPTPGSFARNIADEGILIKRPVSAPGTPELTSNSASPSTKRKYFWSSHSNECSPKSTPSTEKTDPISALPAFAPASPSPLVRPKTSPERSATVKKRKVRNWTGHLFSRKGRLPAAKTKARRSPTPPLLTHRASDRVNEVFDADDTIVLRNSPSPDQQRRTFRQPDMLSSTRPTISRLYRDEPDDRVTSPVLDLDAALGPFGSEEKLAGEDNAGRAASSRISRLHSSERRGPVDAFGAFHRRAESAPQMAPVNKNVFGVHPLGSSASVANDVFDEEEEDDFLANEKGSEVIAPETASLAGSSGEEVTQLTEVQNESALGTELPVENFTPPSGLGLALGHDIADNIAIVDTEDDVDRQPPRSSNSTITPPILPDADIPKRPASSPMVFAYGAPQTTYASSTEGRTATNSTISSPDAEHVSFDRQPRVSRYAGEQSLDVIIRGSNDDLPSLTDSVSTGVFPRFSSSAGTRSSTEQRAVSFSGPTQAKSGQAWKRASLASLNRLIPGSANGSKLRFEETAAPAEEEKTKKKTNRISKLVNFWRSKEKAGK